MKQYIFSLLLMTLFATIGCRNTEGVTQIYGTTLSDQVDKAFSQLELGTEVEAKLDTVLGPVQIKLYSGPCVTKVIKAETESATGAPKDIYLSVNDCTQMLSQLKACYVYIPVIDEISNRPVWIPVPALLKQLTEEEGDDTIYTFEVREIFLNSYGDGATKLLVQI